MAEGSSGAGPPIIKKVKKISGGAHHGGAWKVAYADFVTAMMAFFLLLWLLNVTTDEQKSGIADYFQPTIASLSRSGAGGVGGGRTISDEGAKSSDTAPTVVVELAPPSFEPPAEGKATDSQLEDYKAQLEQDAFEDAQLKLDMAMEQTPEMQEFQENIKIDMTDEGMRIQIVDQEGGSMFKSGSAEMAATTKRVLEQIAKVIQKLPNSISIAGHTDASPFDRRGYTNWELSTDRANASRRALIGAGIELDRVVKVIGNADMDPLTPEDPFAAHNRRISIVLLREVPVLPPELQKKR